MDGDSKGEEGAGRALKEPGIWSRMRPLIALVAALAVGTILVIRQAEVREVDRREAARAEAGSRTEMIEVRLVASLGVTRALEAMVRTAGGVPGGFEAMADPLLGDVSSLQIQPNGIVSRVAPADGNQELIGRNVLQDPALGARLQALRESGSPGIFAPIQPTGAGEGLAVLIQLPVFLPGPGGAQVFWGFVAATWPLQDALAPAHLGELERMGYRYSLHAAGAEQAPIAGRFVSELNDPERVTLSLPSGDWVLALEPASGWSPPLLIVRDGLAALLLSLLLALLLMGVEGLRSARIQADLAARETAGQRDLLRTVLGSMAEGVAAFDPDLRLSVFNERWAQIRDYPRRLVTPGRPLEDFVRYDVKRGVHGPGEREEAMQRELARIRSGQDPEGPVVLPDGRVLEVRGEALPGGGLVRSVSDVTEQYRARERFRVLFESSPDGHFLVQEGRVVDCNGAALALMGGGSKEEVLGERLSEYLGGEFGAGGVRDLLNRADRDGEVREDWTLPRRDHEPIPFEVTVRRVDLTPAEDALLVVLHDLRERKEMERALRESQQFLKGVVDHSSALISAKDLHGRYILVNPQWERVMGISRRDALGRVDRDLFAEAIAVDRESADHKALEMGEPVITEEQTWVVDRARSFLTVAFPILGPDAEAEAVCRVSTDVTALKEVQGELEVARDRAEAADRAKGDFLANMSHEIRTPMNAIIGLAHLVLKTNLDPRQRDQVRKLEAASRSLLGILNDILDFSKIEAGKLDMESVPFHLEDVLGNVADLFASRAQEKGLEFLVRIDPRTPVRLIGDPLRLGQVLTNLVSNAVKFTDEGEIVIRVEPVRATNGTSTLRFSVRDTGLGLSSEQQTNLFRAFSQGDSSTTRRFGGTGLGLAICRRLVEMMEGEIGVESLEGEGATFHFSASFGRDSAELASSAGMAELHGRRALVADDNESARLVMEELLEGIGLDVRTVATGEEALKEVRAASARGAPYDVAFLDWRMPGMDGFDVAARLHASRLPLPPATILVTAHGRDDVFHRTEQDTESVNAVLLKPVTSSVLLESLVAALDVHVPQGEELRSRRRSRKRAPVTEVEGVRVLLVEDNEVNREVALGLLGEEGAVVETAGHGREALEILEASPNGFEAVLMDVHMPEMDGYDATRAIRANPALAWIPVIAMTAGALEQDRIRCMEAGMDDHVAKPVELDDLFGKLSRWIVEGRKRRREAGGDDEGREARELDPVGADSSAQLDATKEILGERTPEDPPSVMAPEESGPVESGPVESAPVESAPVESAPVAANSATASRKPGSEKMTAETGHTRPSSGGDPDSLRGAGVNVLKGLRHAGGNERLYRRILHRFVETQADAAEQIRSVLDDGQVDEAIRAAHTLKGLAGTVGADDLQRRARELESALREDHIGVVQKRLASVEADLVQIRAALLGPDAPLRPEAAASHEVDELAQSSAMPEDADVERSGETRREGPRRSSLRELMQGLERLLTNGDTRAVTMVDELEFELAGTPLSDAAARVAGAARNYEFEKAGVDLEDLRRALAARGELIP